MAPANGQVYMKCELHCTHSSCMVAFPAATSGITKLTWYSPTAPGVARLKGSGTVWAVTSPGTTMPVQKIVPIEPFGGKPSWKLAALVTTMLPIWQGATQAKKAPRLAVVHNPRPIVLFYMAGQLGEKKNGA